MKVTIGALGNSLLGSDTVMSVYLHSLSTLQYTGSGWMRLGSDIDWSEAGEQAVYSIALSSDGNTVVVGRRYALVLDALVKGAASVHQLEMKQMKGAS